MHVNPAFMQTPFVQVALSIMFTLLLAVWMNNRGFDGVYKSLDGVYKSLDGVYKAFDGLNRRLDAIVARLGRIEVKLDNHEERIVRLEERTSRSHAGRAGRIASHNGRNQPANQTIARSRPCTS